jgi:anthranilate synthase/aminodeoxychorismate synthase-like glutamine amidotransferase
MKVVLIDNYDSFVYNLAQYLGELGATPVVIRNNVELGEVEALEPDALVISPGPGRPEQAGNSVQAIQKFAGRAPILGVCLGHQAIGVAFGGSVVHAESIMHGKTSQVFHNSSGVLSGLPNPFEATRYHSLVVEPETLPEQLEITAQTSDSVVMGIRHREHMIEGVQFHPESVLTGPGMQLIENFLRQIDSRRADT